MPRKVRYESRIFRRDAGWKSMGDAEWKLFPPSIKPLCYALKTHLFVHFKGYGFVTDLLDFPQYLLTLKHHSPIHHLLTAGSNAWLRARGHIGCWVEFRPTSLSEGWIQDISMKLKAILNLRKSRCSVTLISVVELFWKFSYSTAVILPCDISKWFDNLGISYSKRYFEYLSLKCVSDGYPILHQSPGMVPIAFYHSFHRWKYWALYYRWYDPSAEFNTIRKTM